MTTHIARPAALNTQRAYATDVAQFAAWCSELHAPPTGSELLAWINSLRNLRVTSLKRKVAAVAVTYRDQGVDLVSGTGHQVEWMLQTIAREQAQPPRRVTALMPMDMREICSQLQDLETYRARRDHALLLVGWHGALRSSELVNLQWRDVTWGDGHLVLQLRRPKTAQESWQTVRLPAGQQPHTCPIRALRRWRDCEGPLDPPPPLAPVFVSFRYRTELRALQRREVQRIVERACKAAHLVGHWGAHSLRRGCATAMEDAGVPRHLARKHTRHASDATFNVYVDETRIRRQIATAGLL